jgi:nitrogen fixation NifU-like protein
VRNPECGDDVRLFLRVRAGRVEQVRFTGYGCSISQASASMMTQRIDGLTDAELHRVAVRFRELTHGDADAAVDPRLGDLRALAGVARFPIRVRCALLAWEALQQARSIVSAVEPPR